jgi:ABC-type branched-subunit amino acid transport system ATPase component/ABC-type branched-subunit amino acid transport system permease subunit
LPASAVPVLVTIVGYLFVQWQFAPPPGVVLEGLILGGLTALVSFGIALVYRANRVINLAQADLGLLPATIAVCMMVSEPGTSFTSSAGWGVPYWVAVLALIAAAMALGFVVERFLIRRFSKAPRLILMVVTIGLAQILVGFSTAIPSWFGLSRVPQSFEPPFDFTFTIDPIIFDANDVIAAVMVGVLGVGLVAFLRYTGMGIAIRASAESADRASLLGINVGRTQSVVWIVATVLSAAAVFLRAGVLGLPFGSAFGPILLLRALAAAVIGRMENFGVMFVAAVGLGVVERAIFWDTGSFALVDPVLFVILLVTLLLQRRRSESRVSDQASSSWHEVAAPTRPVPRELAHLPEVRIARWLFIGTVAAVLVALPLILDLSQTSLTAAMFIYAVVALSLVVLTGWAGEMSLGQMAFVGIGSATTGWLTVTHGYDLTITVLGAGLLGAVFAVLVGLPALRIRGLFLAVMTLAFALFTSSYLLDRERFEFLPDPITEPVLRLPIVGLVDVDTEHGFYYVCLASLGVALWWVRGLQRSRTFRLLAATRDNERGAMALGLNLVRAKLLAFAVAGFFASFAGGLLALHQQAVGDQLFEPVQSIRVLTMAVVGGLGSVPGALLGTLFLKSTEWFSGSIPEDYRSVFTLAGSGAGLIAVLVFLPAGLGSLIYLVRDSGLRRIARRRDIVVPSLVADIREDHVDRVIDPLDIPPTSPHVPFRWFPRRPAPHLDYSSFPDVGTTDRTALSVSGIDIAYGHVQVLFEVSLEVGEGELIALLGTNGAGKSTVLRAISGLVKPASGTISFDGVDLTTLGSHQIAALGIAQVPGGRGIFPSLTVAENLRAAGWMIRGDKALVAAETERVLALFPAIDERLEQPAATLSGGQQQMLTLAMAMLTRPRVLMIDELSLGLAPAVVEVLLDAVKDLRDHGTTIILVEQSVNIALTVADTAYFMEKGEVRFHGPTSELLDRPDILRSVFLEGAATHTAPERVAATARRIAAERGAPILALTDVVKRFAGVLAIDHLSLTLHEGEILGIIGPNGAGKTTLFDLVSGFVAPDGGRIVFADQDITDLSPDSRARLGLARSFQDARLFAGLTAHQAVAVALDHHLETADPVAAMLGLGAVRRAERQLQARADELLELMGLIAYRDKFISELSTGTRRMVDLACQMAFEPRVILFDEPSSGIAQRETEALGPVLLDLRHQLGASLIVIEHDMPLIRAVSDRIVALDLGRLVVDGDAETVLNHPEVVAAYLGTSAQAIERSGSAVDAARAAVVSAP